MYYVFRFIVTYHIPPSSKNNILKSTFINELDDHLEKLSTLSGKLALLGDFNIHMDCSNDNECKQLCNLLDFVGLTQHVTGSTHVDGHMLNHVITRTCNSILHKCEFGVLPLIIILLFLI